MIRCDLCKKKIKTPINDLSSPIDLVASANDDDSNRVTLFEWDFHKKCLKDTLKANITEDTDNGKV